MFKKGQLKKKRTFWKTDCKFYLYSIFCMLFVPTIFQSIRSTAESPKIKHFVGLLRNSWKHFRTGGVSEQQNTSRQTDELVPDQPECHRLSRVAFPRSGNCDYDGQQGGIWNNSGIALQVYIWTVTNTCAQGKLLFLKWKKRKKKHETFVFVLTWPPPINNIVSQNQLLLKPPEENLSLKCKEKEDKPKRNNSSKTRKPFVWSSAFTLLVFMDACT